MDDQEYLDYLKGISWKGKLYRSMVVYPLIEKWCKGKVLDIGCGMGAFASLNNDYLGVDVNDTCIQFCKKNGIHNVMRMDYDKLPCKTNTIGTCILDNVLEHITDPIPLMIECDRVLTDAGRIIILVPGKKGYSSDTDHKCFYDFEKLNQLGTRLGWHTTTNKSVPYPFLSNYLRSFCFFQVFEKNGA